VELVIALISHWFWPFVNEPWMMFDLVVVVASLVSAVYEGIPVCRALLQCVVAVCCRVLQSVAARCSRG